MQAAARIFFDKPVSQLNLEQSALLAGLPQAPSQYNPLLNPAAARERRNEVLAKMAELHYISEARAQATERAPLEIHRGNYYSERKEDFFFEYVRQQLIERYGAKTVEQGGLKVYTTIDLQHAAPRAQSDRGSARRTRRPGVGDRHDRSPHNGDIEAMAESESYEQSQYNLAADGHRQPGSTFKAIDLADALSRGIDPNTTDYYSHTLEPGWLAAEPKYEVKTFEGVSEDKSMNLVTATLKSDNTVYAQLAADLGEETITHIAYEMGVKTHLLGQSRPRPWAASTLGVTPLEMADVYATLADGGWRNTPIAITKVVFPDGRVDEQLGHAAPRESAQRSGHRRGDEHPARERRTAAPPRARRSTAPPPPRRARPANLIDAWLDGYTPALLDGRVDGLPQARHPDDRRARRAAAGRLPAGGNLARLHGGGHRRPAVRRIPAVQGSDRLRALLRQVREHRPRNRGTGSRELEPNRPPRSGPTSRPNRPNQAPSTPPVRPKRAPPVRPKRTRPLPAPSSRACRPPSTSPKNPPTSRPAARARADTPRRHGPQHPSRLRRW